MNLLKVGKKNDFEEFFRITSEFYEIAFEISIKSYT